MRIWLTLFVVVGASSVSPARAEAQTADPAALIGMGATLGTLSVSSFGLALALGSPSRFGEEGDAGGLFLGLVSAAFAGSVQALPSGIGMALGVDPSSALDLGAVTSFAISAVLLTIALAIGLDPDARLGNIGHDWSMAWPVGSGVATSLVGGGVLVANHVR